MKGKRMLFGMMIVAALLIMAQPSVSNAASYSGAWLSNDATDWFAVDISIDTNSTDSFSMYKWKQQNNDLNDDLMVFSAGVAGMYTQTVYFTQENSTWYAGLTDGAKTLNLGESAVFGFSFNVGSTPHFDYNLVVLAENESYELSRNNLDITIITSDIQPVPLPASALLLGSGMVGLIGFGKRMRKRLL